MKLDEKLKREKAFVFRHRLQQSKKEITEKGSGHLEREAKKQQKKKRKVNGRSRKMSCELPWPVSKTVSLLLPLLMLLFFF